jgi:DNA-binding IclR family transcriptional regulator
VCRLAQRAGLTAFLVVRDGYEAVTLVSVEIASTRLNVVYSPGTRHSLVLGSPGLAILAGEDAQPGERPEVTRGRMAGYLMTFGEVIPNQGSIAAPVQLEPARAVGSIALTFGHDRPGPRQVEALLDSARVISGRLAQAIMRGAVVPDLRTEVQRGDPRRRVEDPLNT